MSYSLPQDVILSPQDDLVLIKFIFDLSHKQVQPFCMAEFMYRWPWVGTNSHAMRKRIDGLLNNGHTLEGIEFHRIIQMAFVMSVSISKEFEEKIRLEADLKLDNRRRILRVHKRGTSLPWYTWAGEHVNVPWREKTLLEIAEYTEESVAIMAEIEADMKKASRKANNKRKFAQQSDNHCINPNHAKKVKFEVEDSNFNAQDDDTDDNDDCIIVDEVSSGSS
ncbi:hypothetical protein GCK72_023241 [Caenorhabditis remanei]|uniref:SPK domain-containing protein n=1 Tax=Caenorhabditis remanei TaxID=31234 RepID=A0A6A5FWA8_CAERE|nr:hypothetical protein GCK72_023241 [Caenorhabditis remanei]KAF1746784.1 hypothetical protein GCK72_023241 [Caenorhabditis remanei]